MGNLTINYDEVAFGIISKVGEAKYLVIAAFNDAHDNGDFDGAKTKLLAAERLLNAAGSLHMDIIAKEAEGNQLNFSVIFMHAEDQFLTVQTFALTVKMMIKTLAKISK